MTDSQIILNYVGPLDFNRIDLLLVELKEELGLLDIGRPTEGRVYAIVVECLENIIKYSAKTNGNNLNKEPAISVIKRNGHIIIKAGNTIEEKRTGNLLLKIDEINSLSEKELRLMFIEKLNNEQGDHGISAGLGLILMKLKSGNKIAVSVSRLKGGYNYLELTICVNRHNHEKIDC